MAAAKICSVDACDIAAARAKDLERGDALAASIEIGGDAAADADSGNDQRGEPDQRQEFAHPADEAVGTRRGAVGGAEIKPGFGEAGLQRLAHLHRIAHRVEGDAGLGLIHRARRDQTGTDRQLFGGDHRRAELKAFAELVGFAGDDAADREPLRPDGDRVACRDAEPVGRTLAEPDLSGWRRAHRAPVLERQFAIERISVVDRLEPDRDRLLPCARHRLHAITAREFAIFGQRGGFLIVKTALPQLDLEIAA